MVKLKARKLEIKEMNGYSNKVHTLTAYILKYEAVDGMNGEMFSIEAGIKNDWMLEGREFTLADDDYPEVQEELIGAIKSSVRALENDWLLEKGVRLAISQYVI